MRGDFYLQCIDSKKKLSSPVNDLIIFFSDRLALENYMVYRLIKRYRSSLSHEFDAIGHELNTEIYGE